MTARVWIAIGALVVAVQAGVLFMLGQPALCECGVVKIWEGAVASSGNSQQFSDWYSFSHIIHGFAFFLFLTALFPRLSMPARLAIAIGIEAGWEILENTPMVIEHYRQQALAQGYVGDSILNSLMDTAMMVAGFLAAARIPWWTTLLLALALEAFTISMIRDGLAFNIIGFIAPELLSGFQTR